MKSDSLKHPFQNSVFKAWLVYEKRLRILGYTTLFNLCLIGAAKIFMLIKENLTAKIPGIDIVNVRFTAFSFSTPGAFMPVSALGACGVFVLFCFALFKRKHIYEWLKYREFSIVVIGFLFFLLSFQNELFLQDDESVQINSSVQIEPNIAIPQEKFGESIVVKDEHTNSTRDFRGEDFKRADLRGTTALREADLRGADLSEANLRGADLRGADLGETNLYGADLRNAKITEEQLNTAVLCQTIFDPGFDLDPDRDCDDWLSW